MGRRKNRGGSGKRSKSPAPKKGTTSSKAVAVPASAAAAAEKEATQAAPVAAAAEAPAASTAAQAAEVGKGGADESKPGNDSPGISATKEALTVKLEARPAVTTLRRNSILPDGVSGECRTISAKKKSLETHVLSKQLSAKLDKQPDASELERARIIQPHGGRRMSARLQGVSRTLERQMTSQKLGETMQDRPEPQDLVKANVLQGGLAPSLHGPSSRLHQRMRADSVKSLLAGRPEVEQVSQWFGLKKGSVGKTDRMTAVADGLERKVAKDMVNRRLSARPGVEDLERQGIWLGHHSDVPNLQSRRASLNREMTKDQLSYLLEGRPNVAALENLNIFPDTDVAHSLHSKRNVLDRNLRRVSLSNCLARRPSMEDMHTQGYIERPELNDMDSAEGYSEDGSHRPPSNIAFHSMFHHDRRRRYAVALRVTAKLKESNVIDQRSRAALKELILDDDSRVFAAVENFFADNDVQKLMSAFTMLVVH